MNWISFVLEIYCHKLDVIQFFKSIWRSRLFSRQVNITLPCWKKSHLEERFLNSAKRANLTLKSLTKGTGIHLKILYRLLLYGFFFQCLLSFSRNSPSTSFFSRFPVDFVKGLDAVHCADLHTRGIRGGGGRVLNQNKHIVLLVEIWGLPSIPSQILDICEFLFLLQYFYMFTFKKWWS